MKYLKVFENKDIESILSQIKSEFSSKRVAEMYDDEWPNWIDDGWEDDGYDSDYDWYVDNNNGEAQDIVIGEIISWVIKKNNLSEKDKSDLYELIKREYQLI